MARRLHWTWISLAVALVLCFAPAAWAAGPVAAAAGSPGAVDINTADAATLDRALLNVGPAKAAAIVAWREANGPFRRIEDLAEVKGIGPRTLERNAGRIVVGISTRPK